jgi:hypothetical protein
MKTIVSTPTRKTTRNTPLGALLDRALPFRRRNHPFIQVGAGGFSFGIFAPVGAFQPQEVTINNTGHYLISSKSQFNLFKKEL